MEKVMRNGMLQDKESLQIPQGSGLVYEVIRVMDDVPLFFREHFDRFVNSIRSQSGAAPPLYPMFRGMSEDFIRSVPKKDFNYKVLFDTKSGDIYLLENPASYPASAFYEDGIDTEILSYSRKDPHAKITNQELTALADKKRQETGVFELLLADSNGLITEGSRSNVFFVKGDQFFTPPLESVLPGVTRQKILETMTDLKISCLEKNIKTDDLSSYEGAFITGTSPKILPIRRVGQLDYSASLPQVRRLMAEFELVIQKDLMKYRAEAQL